jgi:hypothetical protein
MSDVASFASYDVLNSFREVHRVVLKLAESLDGVQLSWKPDGYSTSIGFHLWHLARESDYLKAALLQYNPQFVPEFGIGKEIWEQEHLAGKWGFPAELHATVGTGLSDQVAAILPIPPKEELIGYLHASYEAIEGFVELLDSRYPVLENQGDELADKIKNVRLNLLEFLTHDCRHLGMMECLKGLQTGFGSATEQRK